MKKFAMLLILALFAISISSVFAQDTQNDAEETDEVQSVTVQREVVVCPGRNVLKSVRIAAELVVEFSSINGEWEIPIGVKGDSENGYTVTIGELVLNCDSTSADVVQIDRSEAFGLNTPPPEPENPPGVAEAEDGYLIVYQGPANLRSCDNPECSRIAIVRGGDALIALGRNASATWWFVQAGDLRGWIWNDLVRIRGDLSGIPIIQTDGEPVTPRVYIGYPGNPLYDELSTAGKVVCKVQGGLEYPLLGRTSDDSWLWIEAQCLDGTTAQGWIEGKYAAIRNLGNVYVPVVGPKGP